MAPRCLEFMSGYWLCSCCYSKTPQAAGLHLSHCFTVSQSRNSAAHWLILQLCQISSLLPQSFCIAFHWILAARSPRWVSDAHTSIVKEGDGDGGWQQPLCISSRSCPSSWVTAEKRTKKTKTPPKGLAAAYAPAISRQRPVPTEALVRFKLGQTKHCVYTDMRFAECIACYFYA